MTGPADTLSGRHGCRRGRGDLQRGHPRPQGDVRGPGAHAQGYRALVLTRRLHRRYHTPVSRGGEAGEYIGKFHYLTNAVANRDNGRVPPPLLSRRAIIAAVA